MTETSSRRDIIFREAAGLFREKGYSGSSLRALADRAGVKGASIYHHFSSKQEILFTIMEYTMNNLIQNVQQVIAGESDPLEQLRKAVAFHIEYHTIDLDETYVADAELRSLEEENYKIIVKMRDDYEGVFRQILQAGQKTGLIHVDDVTIATRALMQMCTGTSYWFNPEGRLSVAQVADRYIDLIFWGLCGKTGQERKQSSCGAQSKKEE